MDIEKPNNTIYYDGFEGEKKIVLSIPDTGNTEIIHIWDGYFEDIFENPLLTETEWSGFAKDYQETVRTFNNEELIPPSSVYEYLSDLKHYKSHTFSYIETINCLDLLISFF